MADRLRLVVLGMMGRSPFGGQTWLYLNWLLGLSQLGHDVWYVEDDSVWPYDPVGNTVTDDCSYAVAHVASCMAQIGMEDRWAFRFAGRDDAVWGLSGSELDGLYRSSDALLNIVGATKLRECHHLAPLRVYVETDPVTAELKVASGESWSPLVDHQVLLTYGENYGADDCDVPLNGWPFGTIRQPIALERWEPVYTPDAACFTTIGNYRQLGGDVTWKGETYRWSKHHEWERFLPLAKATPQPLELALQVSCEDRERLIAAGWRVIPALPMSLDAFGAYPRYIRESRAEFTVAKDQNVRLRSGWFSERDACYLASGKPVVAQDTGFGRNLPTGKGLVAVSTIGEAVDAIEEINGDYRGHCEAARRIAEEFFEARAVAHSLLEQVGLA